MQFRKLLLALCLSLPFSASGDEVVKASEMTKPPQETPSKEAQKKAHKRVEVRKNQLEQKVKEGASPEEIGKAKARVQVDRVESNRQDYLNEAKEELKKHE